MQQAKFICITRQCTHPKIITDNWLIHSENSHQVISFSKLQDKIKDLYPQICILNDECHLIIDNIKQRVGELLIQYVQGLAQTKQWGLIQMIQRINNNSVSEQDLKSDYFNELVDCYNDKKQLLIDFNTKEQTYRIKEKLNLLSQQIYKKIQEASQYIESGQDKIHTPTLELNINQSEEQAKIPQVQPLIQQCSYEFKAFAQQPQEYLRFTKNNTQVNNTRKDNAEYIVQIETDMSKVQQLAFQLQKAILKIGVIDYSKIECITSDNYVGKCFIVIADDLQKYLYSENGKEEVPFEIKIGSLLNVEWDPVNSSLTFLCSKKKKKKTFYFAKTDVSNYDILVWLGPGAQIQVQ